MINKTKKYPRKELTSTPLEEKTSALKEVSHASLKEEECESLAHIQFTLKFKNKS